MRMYTKDEVTADIRQLEGFDIQLKHIDERLVFLQLYSEVYVRISGTKTVDDFKKRMDEYIQQYLCVRIDKEPSQDKLYSLYAGTDKEQHEYCDSFNDLQDILNILSNSEFKNKYSSAIVLSSEYKVLARVASTKH